MILRNVGGLIGEVIPLNLTDRLYIIFEYIIKFFLKSIRGSEGVREPELREGWREGGRET